MMPKVTQPTDRVTLAVLAGGEGSRMGLPKALLEVAGRPVLTHLLEKVDWPGPTVLVTSPGRQRPPGADGFDVEASDPVAGEGPLRGIHTALLHLTTELLIAMPVDMLGVERGHLQWFAERLAQRQDALGVMGLRDKRIEPLPCALRRGAVELIGQRLTRGDRSLQRLTSDPRIATVDTTELPPTIWVNANTPAEWARVTESLAKE
jgi:molybdopterin-guanine dinucleotide biosynthesis protein A